MIASPKPVPLLFSLFLSTTWLYLSKIVSWYFFSIPIPVSSTVIYGFSFVYSGNFLANVEVDMFYNSRVQIGINPFDFSWLLKENEEFQSPEAVLVYSPNGMTGMSHIYHNL